MRERLGVGLEVRLQKISVLFIEVSVDLIEQEQMWLRLDRHGEGEDKCKRSHGFLTSGPSLEIHLVLLLGRLEVEHEVGDVGVGLVLHEGSVAVHEAQTGVAAEIADGRQLRVHLLQLAGRGVEQRKE